MKFKTAVALCALALPLLALAQNQLERVVIDSGTQTLTANGGTVQVQVTIGQANADPQPLQAGAYKLSTGYWGPEADPDLVFKNSFE